MSSEKTAPVRYGAIDQQMKSRFAREMLDRVLTVSPLEKMIRRDRPYVPPTRWQRFTRRLAAYGERIALAWRVLRGDDIHEDCW